MSDRSASVCHALLPCAGTGSRTGQALPKQYVTIAGKAVVAHTLDALHDVTRLTSVLVLLAPDDDAFERHAPGSSDDRIAAVRCGGTTRVETVVNGLVRLGQRGASPDDWVLVHDAARCLVRAAWVDALIDACLDDPVGGLLAWPVADTLKIERDGRVGSTLDRRGAWQAQTPQMFRLGPLLGAMKTAMTAMTAAGLTITDEAGAMEAQGHAPKLVPGALENFKLTYPADFELAERLLNARR